MIDAFASSPHYFDHIAPIWRALPHHLRGTFYTTRAISTDFPTHQGRILLTAQPILVASYADYRSAARRPVIFVEHGAGQNYPDIHSGAYSGGPDRDRVILFICPNETVAERNRRTYPTTPTAIVGCPRLDNLHRTHSYPPSSPIVAFTFHADYRIVPETQSAFPYFRDAIPFVRSCDWDVLGHAHPRAYRRVMPYYADWKIPHTPNLDEVLSKASVLVVDNSSAGFEAASLGIPLVWLSPPFYRREIRAWPRFWDGLILGEEATTPGEVLPAINRAIMPISRDLALARDKFISTVYSYRDGYAADRAAEAIERLLTERVAS